LIEAGDRKGWTRHGTSVPDHWHRIRIQANCWIRIRTQTRIFTTKEKMSDGK